ncbi:hypothetical protein B5D77_09225 [Microcystis sp. MC19]|nr:hypothetical protein B5D77_09225 [Microcystis sp. MC19]
MAGSHVVAIVLPLLLTLPSHHYLPHSWENRYKSVEYRLHIRTGTHARGNHAKRRINNQFLITRFSTTDD